MTAVRSPDVVWRCRRCGHSETQPAHAHGYTVFHLCGKGMRPTRLTPDTPTPVLEPGQQTLWTPDA